MNFFVSFIIFIIILFLYLHLVSQYKRSEDMEIYEMDYSTNKQLQEVCNVKQPILFEMQSSAPEFFDVVSSKIKNEELTHDVKLKDTHDYFHERAEHKTSSVDYIVLPFQSAHKLMKTDSNAHFFIENNNDFLDESGIYNNLRGLDTFLKPDLIAQTKYDICLGSKNTATPLRYHTHYRQFYVVATGKIHVKMTPWKSSKYVHPIKDYENYEFRSPVNVWNPQQKYLHDMDKTRFLEFDVHAGYVLYIPPYWWYSIKYSIEENTTLCGFTYNSPMNILSNIPDWALYFIQQQNLTKKTVKTLKTDESETSPNNENIEKNELSEAKSVGL